MAVDTQQLSKVMLSDERGAVSYPALANCIALLQLESRVHWRFHQFSSDMSEDEMSEVPFHLS